MVYDFAELNQIQLTLMNLKLDLTGILSKLWLAITRKRNRMDF